MTWNHLRYRVHAGLGTQREAGETRPHFFFGRFETWESKAGRRLGRGRGSGKGVARVNI